MTESRFVTAYDAETGHVLDNPIPEHWFDVPDLAAMVRKSPRQKAADKARQGTSKPATSAAEKEQ